MIAAPAAPNAPAISKPVSVPTNFQAIPAALQALPQWVAWRYELRAGKWDKVPYQAPTNTRASSTDPSTWCSFAEAVRFAPHYNGIGFVLVEGNGLVIIDLDDKETDPATPDELGFFTEIIANFATYTELSVGGRGCHIVAGGVLPKGIKGRRTGHIEIYSAERYLTFTGNTELEDLRFVGLVLPGIEAIWEITNCQREIDYLLRVTGMGASASHTGDLVELPPTRTDAEVWAALFNHHEKRVRIASLAAGQWASLGYPSASEADMALIAYIANSTRSNAQVRCLFRRTVLATVGRKNDKHMRSDYHIDFCLRKIRAEQAEVARVLSTSSQAIAFEAAFAKQQAEIAAEDARKQVGRDALARCMEQAARLGLK